MIFVSHFNRRGGCIENDPKMGTNNMVNENEQCRKIENTLTI